MLISASELIAGPRTDTGSRRRATIPRSIFRRLLAACDILTEFFICTALLFTAQWLELPLVPLSSYSSHEALAISILIAALTTAFLNLNRAHHKALVVNPVRETAADIQVSLQALVLVLVAGWLLHPKLPYLAILIALLLTPAALMLQRRLFALILRTLNQRRWGTENVIICGASPVGRRIASTIQASPRLALAAVAVIDCDFHSVDECRLDMAFRDDSPLPIECAPVTPGLLQSFECDLLLVAVTGLSREQESHLEAAAQAGSRIARLVEASLYDLSAREFLDLDDLFITQKLPLPAYAPYTWGKRAFDLFASALLLILLFPFFVLIALLIPWSGAVCPKARRSRWTPLSDVQIPVHVVPGASL